MILSLLFLSNWSAPGSLPGPRDEVALAREALHVVASLGHDRGRNIGADPGHGHDQRDGFAKGHESSLHALPDGFEGTRDGALSGVDVVEVQTEHDPLVRGHSAVERRAQDVGFRFEARVGELGEHRRIRLAVADGLDHRTRALASSATSSDTNESRLPLAYSSVF